MARPKGFSISRTALDDVLRLKRLSLTEAAERSGVALTTLSGLFHGDHGASMKTVRALAEGLEVHPETLFPALLVPESVPA